jgi:hypothetical protein
MRRLRQKLPRPRDSGIAGSRLCGIHHSDLDSKDQAGRGLKNPLLLTVFILKNSFKEKTLPRTEEGFLQVGPIGLFSGKPVPHGPGIFLLTVHVVVRHFNPAS